jgi:hypothetical protein
MKKPLLMIIALSLIACCAFQYVPTTYNKGGGGASAPLFVQDTYNTSACAGGPATCAAASINTTTGNFLYAEVFYQVTTTFTSFTDTCGTSGGASNTYTTIASFTGNSGAKVTIAYTQIGFGKACVVTANLGGTPANNAQDYVAEISGANTSTPVGAGQFASAVQSTPGTGANALSSGNLTTTQTNTLVIGTTITCFGNPDSFSAGTGFTIKRNVVSGNCNLGAEIETFASSGAIAAIFTTTPGTNLNYNTVAVAFQHP